MAKRDAHWYAVRTKPGMQAPYRERWSEPTASALSNGKTRGKGYAIASSVNPMQSVIEAALEAKGIPHYMPAEFAVVRNRHHAGLYEIRRFALMKGYVFVELEDKDWPALMDISGVQGVVANNGNPFRIGMFDMLKLRLYEKNLYLEAQSKAESLSRAQERLAREKRKVIVRNTKKKLHKGRKVRLIWGDKAGRDATVQAWTDEDQVQVIIDSLDGATETLTYPYEYLKAAE